MKTKNIAMENLNLLLIDNKMNAYIKKNGLTQTEERCRLVKMTLRHHVHHFPENVPFIAAVKKCGEQNVVFFLKRTKMASIADIDISSETNIKDSFEVDGQTYKMKDTINGFPRYHLDTKKKKLCSKD